MFVLCSYTYVCACGCVSLASVPPVALGAVLHLWSVGSLRWSTVARDTGQHLHQVHRSAGLTGLQVVRAPGLKVNRSWGHQVKVKFTGAQADGCWRTSQGVNRSPHQQVNKRKTFITRKKKKRLRRRRRWWRQRHRWSSSLLGSSFPRNPLTNQTRGFLEILFLGAGLINNSRLTEVLYLRACVCGSQVFVPYVCDTFFTSRVKKGAFVWVQKLQFLSFPLEAASCSESIPLKLQV